jgi:hypothetical protein
LNKSRWQHLPFFGLRTRRQGSRFCPVHFFLACALISSSSAWEKSRAVRFHADVANIGNTLEFIDFGGLFSCNAIGPARQFTFHLVTNF